MLRLTGPLTIQCWCSKPITLLGIRGVIRFSACNWTTTSHRHRSPRGKSQADKEEPLVRISCPEIALWSSLQRIKRTHSAQRCRRAARAVSPTWSYRHRAARVARRHGGDTRDPPDSSRPPDQIQIQSYPEPAGPLPVRRLQGERKAPRSGRAAAVLLPRAAPQPTAARTSHAARETPVPG